MWLSLAMTWRMLRVKVALAIAKSLGGRDFQDFVLGAFCFTLFLCT